MWITKKYVSMAQTVTILTLFLVATSSINLVHSSVRQELSVQSIGTILDQDNFADKIFFEYGAESGVLQSPWDLAGGSGSGDQGDSYIKIDSTHVRTGSKAVKFYSEPPPKDDKARRMVLRLWNTGRTEYYASWWLYLPSESADFIPSNGVIIGALNAWYGRPGIDNNGKWQDLTSVRFFLSQTSRYVSWSYTLPFDGGYDMAFTSNIAPLNEWMHFQIYVKWATDNTGIYRWWYNDILINEVTGVKNHPEGYAEWNEDYEYAGGVPYPAISITLYYNEDSPERWHWVDDIVASTVKVSESYGVVD